MKKTISPAIGNILAISFLSENWPSVRFHWPVTPKSIPPPKSGPPGPIFAKKMVPGPILAAKIVLPGLTLAAKIGPPLAKNSPPTDHDARTEFGSPD